MGNEELGGDEWGTPQWVFEAAVKLFGEFDLDVCAAQHNTKCSEFFTKRHNGLVKNWFGNCWCNPPYSDPRPWAAKAIMEVQRDNATTVVMLLPSDTSTRMFHLLAENADITLLDQRIKFVGALSTPKFGSMFARIRLNTIYSGCIKTSSIRQFQRDD